MKTQIQHKVMAWLFAAILTLLPFSLIAQTQVETIEISDKYTTHLIFRTEIVYANLSSSTTVKARIISESKNIVALMAVTPFEGTSNISMMESNGVFHTYMLKYVEKPSQLVIDTRPEGERPGADGFIAAGDGKGETQGTTGGSITRLRKADAPLLKDVLGKKRELYHLSTKYLKVLFNCENIYAYSDITYLVFSLKNSSGVSYEAKNVIFTIEEEGGRSRNKIRPEPVSLIPKNTIGTLTAAPGEETRMAFSFEKKSLSRNQRLKVYLYEAGGQRNLVLTLSPEDINLAAMP